MKIKKTKSIFIIFIFIFLSLAFSSCGKYKVVEKIQMKNSETIQVEAGNFNYEGIKVEVCYASGEIKEIDLTEDMIPDIDKLNFYKMGEHEINVVYINKFSTSFKINVVRHNFDDVYELLGYTCTYDGQPHSVLLNEELPAGATIEYPYGNTFINAGEYEVVGVISKKGYNSKTLKTKLIIEKDEYDISDVSFIDQTETYDGEPKIIEATNVPSDIEVSYDIYDEFKTARLNNAVNAGTYTIVAKFTSKDANYKPIPNMEAKLTIDKATYDMSNVKIDDYEKEFDGYAYTPRLVDSTALPSGVTVSYKYYNEQGEEVSSNINAGEYKIVASFTSNNANYEKIEPIESKLKVNKRLIQLDGVIDFNSESVNFDRKEHYLEIEGRLPDKVSVIYENNGQVAAGEYMVVAKFTNDDENYYLDIDELDAYLIINKVREDVLITDKTTQEKRAITPDDIEFTIDFETNKRTIEIKGLDKEVYSFKTLQFTDLSNDEIVDEYAFTDGGKYEYYMEAKFNSEVEDSSVLLAPISGIYSCTILIEGDFELPSDTVTYDGNSHTLTLEGELPTGASVAYEYYKDDTLVDEAINVGQYLVKAIITRAYSKTIEITSSLVITKANFDMSFIPQNVTKKYDGNDYTPSFNMPEGLEVETVTAKQLYYGDWQDVSFTKDVGDYKIKLTFSVVNTNYNDVDPVEFMLKVNYREIDLLKLRVYVDNKTMYGKVSAGDFDPHLTIPVYENDVLCTNNKLNSVDVSIITNYYYLGKEGTDNNFNIEYDDIPWPGRYRVVVTFKCNNTNEKIINSMDNDKLVDSLVLERELLTRNITDKH